MTGAIFSTPNKYSTSMSLFNIKIDNAALQVQSVIRQALINLDNFINNDTHAIIRPFMRL